MYKVFYCQFNLITGKFTEGDHRSGLDDGEYTELADNEVIWSETPESPERARQLIREKITEMWNLFDEASQKFYWECGA